MTECFENPTVIKNASENDPQIDSFMNAIKIKSNKTANLLLDFGAGKGRLFEQIRNEKLFVDNFNYCALEPIKEFHKDLEALGAKKIFSTHSELPKNSFDFIVLCNVLHEVPILEWESTLNNIITSLTSDGFLIIIEAKVLTKGEKIGEEGFLLLDRDELAVLFSLNDMPPAIKSSREQDILCTAISRKDISFIDREIIKNTLKILENNSLKKIMDLRRTANSDQRHSSKLGRISAFYSQLHINARIAQNTLESTIS